MILDTNALSDLGAANSNLRSALGIERHLLPVIVVGEYRFGSESSRHRLENLRWLERATHIFQVVEVTLDTAEAYGRVRKALMKIGRPIPENDIWIAALALEHNQPILSQDRHFDLVPGIRRVGW